MTIGEAINKFDQQRGNQHERETKIWWISQLETQVWDELVMNHEHDEVMETFVGYGNHVPMDTVLMIPAPYDAVYIYWMLCQSDLANNEIGRYGNDAALYNVAWEAARKWYGRTHRDLERGKGYFMY